MDDSAASRSRQEETTEVLLAGVRGEERAAERLMPLVYDELRRLAERYMRKERPDHTLQPTALVHEAYLKLVDITRIDWRGKAHFFAMAARQMRRVLVDHARAVGAKKRIAGDKKLTLDEAMALDPAQPLELLALDQAMERLLGLDERRGKVAELRLFAGMEVTEVARALGVSERTVKADWRVARAWLTRELGGATEAPEAN